MSKFNYAIISILCFLVLSCQTEETEQKPNIIIILADDYGYMDSQAYAQHTLGNSKEEMFYETPNIDRLVAEGIAFDQAYANQL